MADALYFGHPGNQGDAVLWGEALGARLAHLSGYQGHGSVATPHNILITWAAIMEGGFQVNAQGRRFSNEALGYSEQAAEVLRQPGGIAFDIFDARIAGVARQFEDFRNAEKAGALITADTIDALAARIGVPADALRSEFDAIECRQAGPLRPHHREVAGGAVLRHQGDRRAVPHPGRARDRYARARAGAQRQAVPQSVRGRRRGGRRVGFQSVRISVRQWTADRDGIRPHRGAIGGRAVSGGNRVVRARPARHIGWNREESRHGPFRTGPQASAGKRASPIVSRRSTGARIATELDAFGCATIGPLLSAETCAAIAARYDEDGHLSLARDHGAARLRPRRIQVFRLSAARHGRGAARSRSIRRSRRSRIAGTSRWGSSQRFPEDHAAYLKRCHAAGQQRPTPLLLRYGAGDYNCLHQDVYGELVFPLQVAFLLSRPGEDFTGGEFVLTEQRPRMQSRAEVVPLSQGEGVIFPVHHRPVQGTRGVYRVNMRHGVSRLRSGRRHTLGIIFHDGK